VRTGRSDEEGGVQACLLLASDEGVPVVATNDVRFIEQDDFDAHEARVCIHESRGLADPDRPRHYSNQQFLRSSADMAELFSDVPEALENALEIARRCNLDLKLGESVLPAFPVPDGQTEAEFLEAEARRGLDAALEEIFAARQIPARERDAFKAPYLARLETELRVIHGMGFPGYFLASFFTGSLLIETIFSLEGMGLLAYQSVLNRDYPVVLGTLYFFTIIGLVGRLLSDLSYVLVDPRISFSRVDF
ncbi:MAG: ABC transporter permease subunit, partial [Desulfuromonadales bacterium]